MKLLDLPKGENSLMAAYESVLDAKDSPERANDLVATYERFFVTAVPPAAVQAPVFERVSLVDPTIRTVIRSTTAAY